MTPLTPLNHDLMVPGCAFSCSLVAPLALNTLLNMRPNRRCVRLLPRLLRLAIADAGCIQVLLEMAKGDHPAEAAAAAGAIWNLAASVPNQAAIADAGGIPVMAGLFVEEGNPGAQLAAAGALCNLMLLPSNRAAILDSGTVPALAEALQCGAPSMKPTVARALYILARSPDGCGAIVDAGGCQPLIAEASPTPD